MNQEQYVKAKLGQRIGELEAKLYQTEFEKLAMAQRAQELQKELDEVRAELDKLKEEGEELSDITNE